MKKGPWAALGAAAIIGMAGMTTVSAEAAWGGRGPGSGYCGNCIQQGQQALSPEAAQAREEFLAETNELRKQLAVKHAELQALMAQASPDEKKVAAATGEAYDLRNALRQKARERGVQAGPGFGGCGPEGRGPGGKGGFGNRNRGV